MFIFLYHIFIIFRITTKNTCCHINITYWRLTYQFPVLWKLWNCSPFALFRKGIFQPWKILRIYKNTWKTEHRRPSFKICQWNQDDTWIRKLCRKQKRKNWIADIISLVGCQEGKISQANFKWPTRPHVAL